MKLSFWDQFQPTDFRLDPPPTPSTKRCLSYPGPLSKSSFVLQAPGQTPVVQTTQNIEHFLNGDFDFIWSIMFIMYLIYIRC